MNRHLLLRRIEQICARAQGLDEVIQGLRAAADDLQRTGPPGTTWEGKNGVTDGPPNAVSSDTAGNVTDATEEAPANDAGQEEPDVCIDCLLEDLFARLSPGCVLSRVLARTLCPACFHSELIRVGHDTEISYTPTK